MFRPGCKTSLFTVLRSYMECMALVKLYVCCETNIEPNNVMP